MRYRAILIATLFVIAAYSSYACSCGASFHAKNRWEVAKLWGEHGETVFEGKVVAVKLHMRALEAKEGEWIPATFGYSPALINTKQPYTSATLEVTKTYRGNVGKNVEVNSFLGGGDCAFQFEVGETYLVFTAQSASGFWTWICSPSTNIRTNSPELRYLRGEKPTPRDLEPLWGERSKKLAKKNEPPAPHLPSGRICGEVQGLLPEDLENANIRIQAAFGSLPYGGNWGNGIAESGHFCSTPLRPGRYVAIFEGRNSRLGDASLTYYPGVTRRQDARVIEIKNGETVNVQFRATWLRTQSVSMYLWTSHSDNLSPEPYGGEVVLISLDGQPDFYRYREKLRSTVNRTHPARINFADVLPGKYALFLNAGDEWLMQRKTVEVADRSQSVFVRLKKR